MRTLYVIDYSNVVYKLKNVFNLSVNISGVEVYTSVLFGFLRLLKSNSIATDIVICLDGKPEASLELLPEYKGTRNHEESNKLYVSKKEVIQYLTQIGKLLNKSVTVLAAPGEEADQVISSVVHLALGKAPQSYKMQKLLNKRSIKTDGYLGKVLDECSERFWEPDGLYDNVIISSTDSDMFQLKELGPVFMDRATNGKNINFSEETPKAVEFVPPSCIAPYKAFIADKSDNVPAVITSRMKSKVKDVVVKHLYSDDLFKQFVLDCRLGLPVIEELQFLKDYLIENNLINDLQRNYEVVKLRYFSCPKIIEFPDYDIKETLEKYRIRV